MTFNIEAALSQIIGEIAVQTDVGSRFPVGMQKFPHQVDQIKEFIDYAGEYALAYEYIICLLEQFPFVLTGQTAVKLLEVGLILQFKTECEEDAEFDSRNKH